MAVQDGLSGGVKIGLAVLVVIVVAFVGLSYYGSHQTVQSHLVEKVIPDAQLAH